MDGYEVVMMRNNPRQEKISPQKAGYNNPSFSYPSAREEILAMKKTGECQKAAVQRYCNRNPLNGSTESYKRMLPDTKENDPFAAGAR